MRLHHKNSFLKAFIKIRSNDLPEQWICDFLTTRAWHLRQDNLVITLLLEVIVINIVIIIVRVFFIAVSIVIAKFIRTINAAAKITPFTSCIPRLRSISLAQPGLTSGELPPAAGCSHVITGTHSTWKKAIFYPASLSQGLKYVSLICK